jgi:cytoskeletal protein CcmA (bactofilin family)
MPTLIRVCLALVATALLGVVAARPAAAQSDGDEPDSIVVVTGRAEVAEGDEVDNVVIADGDVVVDGTVHNGVVAFNGDVVVTGTVEDEVVAFNGRVTVREGGVVEGDVMSRKRPVEESGGRIEGTWEKWNATNWNRATGIVARLALWVAVSISVLLLGLILGLLAPRATEAVDEERRAGFGPVIGWGLLLTIGLPIVAVVALATVVAAPLGLGVLLALGLIYFIGYTAAAWLLGRVVARRAGSFVAFLAGWAILRVLALIPLLGGLAWFGAVVIGLGAIVGAARRSRRPRTAPDDAGSAPPSAGSSSPGPLPPPPASAPS